MSQDLLAAVGVSAGDLAATPQDPGFHAEGDVWTHTQMALDALESGPYWPALDAAARRIVRAAVLLHDFGKPSTTRRDGDKLTSRGHSARGEHLARVALWQAGVPFGAREHVCALVRSHQVPFFGITRDDAERLAIRMSLAVRHDWLVAVADADGRGRRTADPADQTRIVEHCALWAEHCRELGVLRGARAFASDHTRRVWCEAAGRHPDVLAHDDCAADVYLMSGLPACGKDTWLADRGLPAIALDDLRAELEVDPDDHPAKVIAVARDRAREYLRAGTSFAWNATNLTVALRGQLVALFRDYRARVHVVYCEATAVDQLARNRARDVPVPAAVIERMLERWTVPDPSEVHTVRYVVPAADTDQIWPPVKAPITL